jgi:DNA sulfur modification protein DndD
MIFTELVLHNFGPYLGHHVINLRPDTYENSRPIILLGGMNGGGKTTLMDAIRLALYGSRAQCSNRGNLSYGEFLTQTVNNQASPAESARIELAFEHIRNDQWVELRLVRSWTRNPKEGKDNLGIIEGDWPDLALANTWDEYIENFLPLGISNLFLFDGEQVKELAEQEVPPPSVIEAIQSLLGLELSEKLAIDLEILVTRKRKKLASTSQLATLEEIEAKLKKYTQALEEKQAILVSLQANLKKAQDSYQEAAEKFRLEGGKLASERSQLENKVSDLERLLEKNQEELRKLAADTLPLGLIAPLLKQAKNQAETELKIQKAKIASEILQQRDRKLLDYLNQLSLPSAKMSKIKGFMEQEYQALKEDNQSNFEFYLGLEEDKIQQFVNLLDHSLPLQVQLADKQLESLKNLEAEIDIQERQLAIAASPEAYQSLDEALKNAQQVLLECQAAYDAGNRSYEDLKKLMEKNKKELENYSEKAIDRQNNEHLIQSVAKVQETLKLFRERLTLKKLNKLEREVTDCFRYLLHKSELVHRVAIDTDHFSLSLYDPSGQRVPKHRLSAGEKQLLAIAFLWGLARVSGRNLPVAIDTPLGRLDSSHRNNLVERYFPAASHQVILLSTDTEIGQPEVEQLRQQDAIARQYLLQYDPNKRQTLVQSDRYFW